MTGRVMRGYELGEIPTVDAAAAMAIARRIEAATMVASPTDPTVGFTDRVMAVLADEPGPASAAFVAPLRKLGVLAGFGASIRQAVLTIAAAGVSLAGAATFGAAGAFGLLGPTSTHTPAPTPAPIVAPVITREPVAEPIAEPSIEPRPEPSESAHKSEGSDNHGGGTSPEASDDHGDNSGPGGGGGNESSSPSGDESGPGDSSPGATEEPGGSDDGGGSD